MKTWQKLPIRGKEKRLQMFKKKKKRKKEKQQPGRDPVNKRTEKKEKQKRNKNYSLGGGLFIYLFFPPSQSRPRETGQYASEKVGELGGGNIHVSITSPPLFP